MSSVPRAVRAHYKHVLARQAAAIGLAGRAWSQVSPRFIAESWAEQVPVLIPRFEAIRASAAVDSAIYTSLALSEQGQFKSTESFIDTDGFMSTLATGGDLEAVLVSPVIRTKQAIKRGVGVSDSLEIGKQTLFGVLTTALSDTGRQVGGVTIVSRPQTSYTRMLNPPSCERCTVLAGKLYLWNTGFLRHPRCDCIHVPTTARSTKGARDEGLIDDPYEYFNSLSEDEQDRIFGSSYARAVRDGADIFQVVNSKTGRRKFGLFTTQGRTKQGYAGQRLKRGQQRLTPEGIYQLAAKNNLSRKETLGILREHSYILPGGQNPKGSIKGQVFSTRQFAWRNEAEKRLMYARRDYEETLAGLNPYTEAAIQRRLGVRPWTVDRPLTDSGRARAEAWFQTMQATGGQLYLPDGTDARKLYRQFSADRLY